MDVIREWANQSAFLASILAGFSLAVVVQLLTSDTKDKTAMWATVAFVISAALLLGATAASSVVLMRWEYWQQVSVDRQSLAQIVRSRDLIGRLLMAGLMLFLTGLGLTGWLHSKAIGALTTGLAVATALFVFWFTRALP